MKFLQLKNDPIVINDVLIDLDCLIQALQETNNKLLQIQEKTALLSLPLFEVIDFRTLSGTIGELFSKNVSKFNAKLMNNLHFHGYPDLMLVKDDSVKSIIKNKYIEKDDMFFIEYPFGGIEIKNTFGVKKQNSNLIKGDTRILKISKKLQWKAHHRKTNNLLGLFSDYINGVPQIVAMFYSDKLEEADWQIKQNPKPGSAMTSFSAILPSGYNKMLDGIITCIDDIRYLEFFNIK